MIWLGNSCKEHAVLTPQEMAQADDIAANLGAGSFPLMQRAAQAVAERAKALSAGGSIAVLAGPGNNGGDAILAASILAEEGRDVRLFLHVSPKRGDAAQALKIQGGRFAALGDFDPSDHVLAIDGLFGAGLDRPLEGAYRAAVERLAASGLPTLAIDLPSGVDGTRGSILGTAAPATETLTFCRRTPAHLLEPGASLCGRLHVADIGIPDLVLDRIDPQLAANHPAIWADRLSVPARAAHKYARGHAVVFSGGHSHTGAARLAAMAALRGGAGLVTLMSPGSALAVNAAQLTAIMLRRCDDAEQLAGHLSDTRLNAFVLGPGFGIGPDARSYARGILQAGRALVLDADGISSFADHAADLFQLGAAAPDHLVLTPHMGEFTRLFPQDAAEQNAGKVELARRAARQSGAVIVLKGSDTVIAAPDGRALINETGTPALATAGTGDVLAGLVGAQLANGVPAFEAAAAAVWLHGVAARLHGPGLIAEDLPGQMPRAISALYSLCGFSLPGWPA